jgi:hypothetical protein
MLRIERLLLRVYDREGFIAEEPAKPRLLGQKSQDFKVGRPAARRQQDLAAKKSSGRA